MNTIKQTASFVAWLKALKDPKGKAAIIERLHRARQGSLGDVKPVGDGVSEMRVHAGPGYRLYLTRRGETIYILLIGGSKRTQRTDIEKAKALARDIPGQDIPG